jgi:hypothetical protein
LEIKLDSNGHYTFCLQRSDEVEELPAVSLETFTKENFVGLFGTTDKPVDDDKAEIALKDWPNAVTKIVPDAILLGLKGIPDGTPLFLRIDSTETTTGNVGPATIDWEVLMVNGLSICERFPIVRLIGDPGDFSRTQTNEDFRALILIHKDYVDNAKDKERVKNHVENVIKALSAAEAKFDAHVCAPEPFNKDWLIQLRGLSGRNHTFEDVTDYAPKEWSKPLSGQYDLIYILGHGQRERIPLCETVEEEDGIAYMPRAPLILVNSCYAAYGNKALKFRNKSKFRSYIGPSEWADDIRSEAFFEKLIVEITKCRATLPKLVCRILEKERRGGRLRTRIPFRLYGDRNVAISPLFTRIEPTRFLYEKQFSFLFEELKPESEGDISQPYLNPHGCERDELMPSLIAGLKPGQVPSAKNMLFSLPLIRAAHILTCFENLTISAITFSVKLDNAVLVGPRPDENDQNWIMKASEKGIAVDGLDMLYTLYLAESLERGKPPAKPEASLQRLSDLEDELLELLSDFRYSPHLHYGLQLGNPATKANFSKANEKIEQGDTKPATAIRIMDYGAAGPELYKLAEYLDFFLLYRNDKNTTQLQEWEDRVRLRPFQDHIDHILCFCGRPWSSDKDKFKGIMLGGEKSPDPFAMGPVLLVDSSYSTGNVSLTKSVQLICRSVHEACQSQEGPAQSYLETQLISRGNRLYVELEIRYLWALAMKQKFLTRCDSLVLPRAGGSIVVDDLTDLVPFVVTYSSEPIDEADLLKAWVYSSVPTSWEFVKEIVDRSKSEDQLTRDFSVLLMKALDYLGRLNQALQHFREVVEVPSWIKLEFDFLLEELIGSVQDFVSMSITTRDSEAFTENLPRVLDVLDVIYRTFELLPQIAVISSRVWQHGGKKLPEENNEEIRAKLKSAFPIGWALYEIMTHAGLIIPHNEQDYPLKSLTKFSMGIMPSLPTSSPAKILSDFVDLLDPRISPLACQVLPDLLNLLSIANTFTTAENSWQPVIARERIVRLKASASKVLDALGKKKDEIKKAEEELIKKTEDEIKKTRNEIKNAEDEIKKTKEESIHPASQGSQMSEEIKKSIDDKRQMLESLKTKISELTSMEEDVKNTNENKRQMLKSLEDRISNLDSYSKQIQCYLQKCTWPPENVEKEDISQTLFGLNVELKKNMSEVYLSGNVKERLDAVRNTPALAAKIQSDQDLKDTITMLSNYCSSPEKYAGPPKIRQPRTRLFDDRESQQIRKLIMRSRGLLRYGASRSYTDNYSEGFVRTEMKAVGKLTFVYRLLESQIAKKALILGEV